MDIQELANIALVNLQELEQSASEVETQIAEMQGQADHTVTQVEARFLEAVEETTALMAAVQKMRADYAIEREQALGELTQLEAAIHQFRDDAVRDLSQVETTLEQTSTSVTGLIESVDSMEQDVREKIEALEQDLEEKTDGAQQIADQYIDRFNAFNDAAEEGRNDIAEAGENLKSNVQYQHDEVLVALKQKFEPIESRATSLDSLLENEALARNSDSSLIISKAGASLRAKVAEVKEAAGKFHEEMEERLEEISDRGGALIFATKVAETSMSDLTGQWGVSLVIFRSATETLKALGK
ncbi:MAG: hypothetical protein ACR2IE_04980 [Candidatus Sumerlaeaceae bacterium]